MKCHEMSFNLTWWDLVTCHMMWSIWFREVILTVIIPHMYCFIQTILEPYSTPDFGHFFHGKLQKGIKKFHLASKTLGHGGHFWLWRHSWKCLVFRQHCFKLPSNKASIQNVRCGRDYICAKFYALILFCSILQKSGGLIHHMHL